MSTDRASAPKRTIRRRLQRIMRARGWDRAEMDNRVRGRIFHLVLRDRWPWWDWGHPLMIVVGHCVGGNYGEPEPPTWYYRIDTAAKRMWRTGYPRPRLHVVRSYREFMAETEGIPVDSDEHYPWRAICVGQDNGLHLGRQYWGGGFYGLTYVEMRLLVRWLIRWEFQNWFGIRSWIYSQALHAAVHQRKPFTCQEVPPKGQGGYSHWHCQLKRGHDGFHSFNAYQWGEIDGEPIGALVKLAAAVEGVES